MLRRLANFIKRITGYHPEEGRYLLEKDPEKNREKDLEAGEGMITSHAARFSLLEKDPEKNQEKDLEAGGGMITSHATRFSRKEAEAVSSFALIRDRKSVV